MASGAVRGIEAACRVRTPRPKWGRGTLNATIFSPTLAMGGEAAQNSQLRKIASPHLGANLRVGADEVALNDGGSR